MTNALNAAQLLYEFGQEQETTRVEQVQILDDVLYAEWVGRSEDPNKIMGDPLLTNFVAAFPTVMAEADWPKQIDQLIIDIYDPADSREEREDAIRISISRQIAKQFDTENKSDKGIEDFMLKVVNSAKYIAEDGTMEDLDVDARRAQEGNDQ